MANQPLTYMLTCEYCSSRGPLFVIEPEPGISDYIVCEKHRELILDTFQKKQEAE